MISAIIAKDLSLIARDRVFRIVLAGYLFVYLAASLFFFSRFLAANDSLFAAMSASLFFRISSLQAVLLAVLTPWLILRMHEQDLGGESRPLEAIVMVVPWKTILAKVIATAICLLMLIMLAMPVLWITRLLGASSFQQIGWVLMDTVLFLMVLAILVFHLRLRWKHWLFAWVLSYAALGIMGFAWYRIWSLAGREACSLVFLILLVLFGTLLFPHGNRVLLYERN